MVSKDDIKVITSGFGENSGYIETPIGKFTIEFVDQGRLHSVRVSFQPPEQNKPTKTEETEAFGKRGEALDEAQDLLGTVDGYDMIYPHLKSGIKAARVGQIPSLDNLQRQVNRENDTINGEARSRQR